MRSRRGKAEAASRAPDLCCSRGPCKDSSHSDVGPYVLVEAEEVVRVVAVLECLEPIVLLGPVGLSPGIPPCTRYPSGSRVWSPHVASLVSGPRSTSSRLRS